MRHRSVRWVARRSMVAERATNAPCSWNCAARAERESRGHAYGWNHERGWMPQHGIGWGHVSDQLQIRQRIGRVACSVMFLADQNGCEQSSADSAGQCERRRNQVIGRDRSAGARRERSQRLDNARARKCATEGNSRNEPA